MDQAKILADILETGVEEKDMGSSSGYEESLCEVSEVETDMTGPEAAHKLLQSWDKGQAILVVHVKVLEGTHKGVLQLFYMSLLTKSGKVKAHPSFEGKDGKFIKGLLGDIIHLIKEHDESSWDQTPFKPNKLTGKKFKVGVMELQGNEGSWHKFAFPDQLRKDEEYQNNKPAAKESSNTSIDPNELPF